MQNLKLVRILSGIAVATGLCAVVFLGGCSNSSTDTTTTSIPTTSQEPQKAPPTAPAVDAKLSFDHLVLESPVTTVKESHGLTYKTFKYADTDGKIYKCKLPQAMTGGSHTPTEWLSSFSVYREPEVLGQKKIVKKKIGETDNLNDFPFIAPRPQKAEKSDSTTSESPTPRMPMQAPMPAPMPTPSIPPTPSHIGG